MLIATHMVTRKNWRRAASSWLMTVASAGLLAGCGPRGPQALLEGDRLVQQGKYTEAIAPLKKSTEALPTEARAWNVLGLAYHGAGRFPEAVKSYHQALTLNPNLAAARFNLGITLMAQNNFAAAADEFTSYTLLQQRDVNGWLRRGQAELRARRFVPAETSYRMSTNLNPHLPEAYNALGLIQLNRGHARDSVPLFTTALQFQTNYAPALLNLAIVEHYYLPPKPVDCRPYALQRYHEYLALKPRPANADQIEAVARQLSLELFPPKPTPTNAVVQTNRVVTTTIAPPTNLATAPRPVEAPTNPPARTEVIPNPPTNKLAAATTLETPAAPKVEPPPTPVKKIDPPVAAPPTQSPPPKTVVSAPEPIAPAGPAANPPAPTNSIATRTNKPGLLERMNPLTYLHRETKPPPVTPVPVSTNPALKLAKADTTERPAPPSDPGTFPRYRYHTFKTPTPGDRAAADAEIEKAKRAQRDGQSKEAIAASQRAVKADPAYFTAHFNLGLMANEAGELPLALTAYQNALGIEPASVAAQFNFALALQRAGYVLDAAAELEKLLEAHPDEPRTHLALANLCAQRLNQPAKAREHYLAVLKLDPENAQATQIRYWLQANP